MGAPQRTGDNGRQSAGRRRAGGETRQLTPLLIVLGGAAVAVLLVIAVAVTLLLLRGGPGGKQEVVGSALPPGWQPGSGPGVGQLPPPPDGGPPPAPAGTPPPAPEVTPLTAAPPPPPTPEGLPFEGATPPFGGEGTEAPPEGAASFEPPRLLFLPTPEYPRVGRRFGREGTVELQVLVGADGSVVAAEPVGERLGMGFEAAARRAAFGARFAPATRYGEPVEAQTRIAIRFRLR